ncbi:MAG: hypothetical protein DI609_01360 [Corynebacterium urealyticum]|uniref:HNH nuclease domain-containing protein n=1 Tax=Corynebacterium urealyticum TaxID=43771 RepID=A0A2W5D840_9CORY|nr:MAG: hypothetical protein DI609_01360 [Corynebacterium urealyticum]
MTTPPRRPSRHPSRRPYPTPPPTDRSAGRSWSGRRVTELTAEVLAQYGDRCHLCGLTGATTADHIVPRSKGGSDELDNLRPAHKSCNSARGARDLAAWRVVPTENGEQFFS